MLLMVGLGNPGTQYARNRHNIGFMLIERLIERHKFGAKQKRFQGIVNEGTIEGEKILALRPQTYMNESGRSVGGAAHFYKLTPDEVFVFHDEIDLAFAKVRVKTGGGSAGNNGIKSVTAHLGPDYHRIRIGVGHPREGHGSVLTDFSREEMEIMGKLIDCAADNAAMLVKRDFNGYMNRLAIELNPPRNTGTGKPDKSSED